MVSSAAYELDGPPAVGPELSKTENEAGLLRWPRILHGVRGGRGKMSGGTFAIVLVCGAALIALWLNARKPNLAPEGLPKLLIHVGIAMALMRLVPASGGSVAFAYVVVFASLLPVLVYAFLVAIWAIRIGQGAMAAYR
jgi:hypothetical protein